MARTVKCFLFLFLISASPIWQANINAQSSLSGSKGAVGITYSGLGINDAFYFQDIIGGGDYRGKGYYSLGMTYIHPLTRSIELETGISYSKYKYQFSNASLGPDGPEPYQVTNAVIDIPLTVRWTFLDYFFCNGGLSLGINAQKDHHLESQTGIGAMVGVGAKYDFKNMPVGLFVNPYIKLHSLIPFSNDNHHRRASESGFRFGVVYTLL